jgi:diguanylate cyclase
MNQTNRDWIRAVKQSLRQNKSYLAKNWLIPFSALLAITIARIFSDNEPILLISIALCIVLLLVLIQGFIARSPLIDPLTGLPNRRAFLRQIEKEAARAQRCDRSFAVLFLEIIHFRNLNNTYGLATGDQTLLEVANKLTSIVRKSDFIARSPTIKRAGFFNNRFLARTAGDQFAIVMDLSPSRFGRRSSVESSAYQFASRIVSKFKQPLNLGKNSIDVGVNVAITLIEPEIVDMSTILGRLENSLLQARNQYHDPILVFDINDRKSKVQESRLDYQLFRDLKQSIRRNEDLEIVFQPIVRNDSSWWGVEALARWEHPIRGAISPEEFTGIAEEYRLMPELGDLLFKLSLEGYNEIKDNLDLPSLRLSTNISPTQLSDPGLHERIISLIKQHNVNPSLVTIEITESTILELSDASILNLERLRVHGIELALDDFGSGYSSLSLITNLHPHEVKIDKSFVGSMVEDLTARRIVATMCGMAKTMDMYLVAEGVEDATTLNQLLALGVIFFQGYFFSKPASAKHLVHSFKDRDRTLRDSKASFTT